MLKPWKLAANSQLASAVTSLTLASALTGLEKLSADLRCYLKAPAALKKKKTKRLATGVCLLPLGVPSLTRTTSTCSSKKKKDDATGSRDYFLAYLGGKFPAAAAAAASWSL